MSNLQMPQAAVAAAASFDEKMLLPFFMNPSVDSVSGLATPPFVQRPFTPTPSPVPSSTSSPVSRRGSLHGGELMLPPTVPSSSAASVSSPLANGALLPERVPRPLNCFMTYRKEKQHEVLTQKGPECNNKEVSRLVAEMWNAEPEEVKEIYRQKAELARQEHARKYPGYKYRPRKRAERVRQQQEAEERRRAERRAKREIRMSVAGRNQLERRLSRNQRRIDLSSPIYGTGIPFPTTTALSSGNDSPIMNEGLYNMSPVTYPSQWVGDASTNFTQMLLQDQQQNASNFVELQPQLNLAATNGYVCDRSPSFSPQPSSVADSDELSGVAQLDSVFMTPALGPTDLPLSKDAHFQFDLSSALEPWTVTPEGMNPFSMMLSQ